MFTNAITTFRREGSSVHEALGHSFGAFHLFLYAGMQWYLDAPSLAHEMAFRFHMPSAPRWEGLNESRGTFDVWLCPTAVCYQPKTSIECLFH